MMRGKKKEKGRKDLILRDRRENRRFIYYHMSSVGALLYISEGFSQYHLNRL